MTYKTKQHTILADTLTPVSIYLKLRDHFPNSILLESNLNTSRNESHSFIALEPISTFQATLKNGKTQNDFQDFLNGHEVKDDVFAAVFGHVNYNAVSLFEDIQLKAKKHDGDIPVMHYSFYRYVIRIDHFTNLITFIEYLADGQEPELDRVIELVERARFSSYAFHTKGEQTSSISDASFMELVQKGKEHCQLGDVFQLVLSRRFYQPYTGDDFQVYRALRSVNPSPYLYYFDMGNYHIFGSSPEAQIKIENGQAVINPIAGTYRRTGNDEQDRELAVALGNDHKENAEHVMLVDLARNDLGRVANQIEVKSFKDIQYYSHVIHMVSEVAGALPKGSSPIDVLGSTFPAGTLSGAPKYRAMQLIDEYEPVSRNYYGGGIGYIELNGNLNHAIMIRSFMSKNKVLHFQAGAGVVVNSNPESELNEVNNKVGALQKAIRKAEELL